MPYKLDKIKLTEQQDRRRKLTQEQKQDIYNLYHNVGGYSLNDLAKIYNVSKKTILLIVNKESKLKNDLHIKNNWKKYYDTKEHSKAMQKTRTYKKELMEKGEI
jgi:transposase